MEKIIVVISIIVIALELGLWIEENLSLSAMLIKRFVIIEEDYKVTDYTGAIKKEARFYPKRKNTLFFIPANTLGLDLMTTLDYKQNFCLTLEKAQEAIKKYIEFNKTKGIKVHKYIKPKPDKK